MSKTVEYTQATRMETPMKRLLAVCLLALVIPAHAQFRAPRDMPRRGPTPAPVLAPLPDCDYRALGRAAAELIDGTTAPTPEPIVKEAPEIEAPRPAVLQLTLKQWANVSIDGRSLGRRQLSARFELPAGKHRVVLQNPAYGERSFEPVLRGGQTQAIEVDFKK